MATTPSAPLQCPDSVPREHMTSREEYRTAGLAEARRIVREDIGHVILPPLDSLWECYPSKHKLDGIKSHLTHLGWLCDGKWNPARLSKQSVQKAGNLTEYEAFKCLAEIFNDVLQLDASTREHVGVKSMIHAGYTEPKSDKISVHRPDAFLFMHSGLNNSPPPGNGGHPPTTPVAIIPTSVYWKDLTCPFEYKFEKGNEDDNANKLIWSLHHEMRSDVRRAFSFGATVEGTRFRIWFVCRATLFMFPSFDWFEDQDSLIHFFSILAFSSESELGFDTEIERVNNSDFELRFCVEEVRYLTSGVLFDIGADATCGRGTRVFEAYQEVQEDDENKVPCIVKDCWVEDCEGKCMEHEIIQQVRGKICSEKFREHFVDFCGYRKTTNEPLDRFCRILTNKTFNVQDVQEWSETLVWTVAAKHHTNYTKSGQAFVSDQRSHLRPTPPPARPQRLPHPRFRYQIVYTEKGTSLHCVTSLSNTFRHLAQVTDGLLLLHKAGFVHRDVNPGNIIVVDGKAKISDLEFAKARDFNQLQTLTDISAHPLTSNVAETRTGTLYFTPVEICEEAYYYRQDSDDTARILLYNPLHDYESVWWIATWVVFSCRLKNLDDAKWEDQKATRGSLFAHRLGNWLSDKFPRHKHKLPEALRPLHYHLNEMKKTLVSAYRLYEESFNSSSMLDVVPHLITHLHQLASAAETIEIEEMAVPLTVERSTMKIEVGDMTNPPPLAVTSRAEPDTADPFRSRVEVVESAWIKGKRARESSPSDPTAKRRMVDA